MLNSTKGKRERIGRLLRMHANKREEIRDIEYVIRRYEPVATIVLGVMVALFAIAVFVPVAKWFLFVNLGE